MLPSTRVPSPASKFPRSPHHTARLRSPRRFPLARKHRQSPPYSSLCPNRECPNEMVSAASPALLTGRLHWPASFRCQGGRGAPCLEGRGWGGILPVRPKRAKLHDGNGPFMQRPLNILVAE